nr:hypothetical protein CFP56_41761 [Quercus suber]
MDRKGQLFLNGEKLKVERAQPQCSPQEGNEAKKRETLPQSSPYKGNGAEENQEGAQGKGTTKQPISHCHGSNYARHRKERSRPSNKYS